MRTTPNIGPTVVSETSRKKTNWEAADIFRLHGEEYRRNHSLSTQQLKVMRAIEICRTAELGGRREKCDHCGYERTVFRSCRNRHCPKCQMLAKAEWVEEQKKDLLPVPYFHTVFTLPHKLNRIILCNKKIVYDIFFKSVSETLREFGEDPKYLGGKITFKVILHTWDQQIKCHVHLHCLIPGGALSNDGTRWIPARPNFLFPDRALSKVYRGKFLDYFEDAYSKGSMAFPGEISRFKNTKVFKALIENLKRGKAWVVHSKPPFAGPEKALEYLARYTHRVAISNNRILNVEDGWVTFSYRDRADDNKRKQRTIPAEKFIRRFLMHVLPKSYMRIRQFGFLINPRKKKNLAKCRELLNVPVPELEEEEPMSIAEKILYFTGVNVNLCPHCKRGNMVEIEELAPLWKRRVSQRRLMLGMEVADSS